VDNLRAAHHYIKKKNEGVLSPNVIDLKGL